MDPTKNTSDLSMIDRWKLAVRPKTLPAALAPVISGGSLAFSAGTFHLLPFLAALVVAVTLQVISNLVNDVADFTEGTDTTERVGPMRVTQAGLLNPRRVWSAVFLCIGVAALAGLYLAFVASWMIVPIGLACIAGAVLYSYGPYSMSKLGLGDLFVAVFFGFIGVSGTVFVVSGSIPHANWPIAFAVGVLTTNILVVNNIRDIETDRKAGRKNIPIRFGRQGGIIEYGLLLGVAYLVPPVLALSDLTSPWVMTAWLSLPRALLVFHDLRTKPEPAAMNRCLANTAQVLLLFSTSLALGLVVEGIISRLQ
jgi:1,4-dihydroxy-2-naphthoate octaprenyltransferase